MFAIKKSLSFACTAFCHKFYNIVIIVVLKVSVLSRQASSYMNGVRCE